jgi:hypothetical protein
MALRPEFSIPTGLAVAAVVYAIHANATPTQADIQALPAGTPDIDRAERKATWLSAGTVAGISLLAKDPTIFVIGAAATIGMAWMTRHANWTESKGTMGAITPSEMQGAGSANTGPEVAQTEEYHIFEGSEFAR